MGNHDILRFQIAALIESTVLLIGLIFFFFFFCLPCIQVSFLRFPSELWVTSGGIIVDLK